MALLSIDMIREIQAVADTYAERERARIEQANAGRVAASGQNRTQRRTPGTRDRTGT